MLAVRRQWCQQGKLTFHKGFALRLRRAAQNLLRTLLRVVARAIMSFALGVPFQNERFGDRLEEERRKRVQAEAACREARREADELRACLDMMNHGIQQVGCANWMCQLTTFRSAEARSGLVHCHLAVGQSAA